MPIAQHARIVKKAAIFGPPERNFAFLEQRSVHFVSTCGTVHYVSTPFHTDDEVS